MSTTYAGKTVAIVSSTNATPIVVTANAHGYSNGDVVNIAGHLVNTAANGTWVAASVAANTITLTSSIGNGAGGATGTVSSYVGSVTLLSDGDTDNAAGRNPAPQGLADRLAMLKADYDGRMLGQFPIVPAKSITRVVSNTPYSPATTQWAPAAGGTATAQWVGGAGLSGTLRIPVHIPHGAKWTGFTITAKEAGANVMVTNAVKVVASTGVESNAGGFSGTVDPAPSTSVHAITQSAGTEVVDNTANLYAILLQAGNSVSGDTYYACTVTYTTNAVDIGGA